MTESEIVKRVQRLESDRKPVEGSWNDIERYVLPLSGKFFSWAGGEAGVNWSTRDVWDSTAPIGAARLASFFWSSLCAPSLYWLDIDFPVTEVSSDQECQAWLQETTRRTYDTLTASNFSLEMASGLLNWVGYGNACLTQEPVDQNTWKGYEFTGRNLREVFFEEDHRGRVRRFFAKFNWTASQLVSKFTDEKTGKVEVPEDILEADKAGRTEPYEVIYAIYPREGAKPMALDEKMRAPERRPFEFKYVLVKGGAPLGKPGGFYEMPAYVMRFDRAVGSQWGFGPGLLALPTVKLVNALQEDIVLAAGKVVDPASLVEERGLIGDLDLERGGLTVVRDPSKSLVPYESKARFDVSDNLLERQQTMIRKFFREDDIGMKASPQMTATEVMQRVTLMNRLFGAQVARAQNDVFDPVVQNTFNGLYREGKIDPPPQKILDYAGKGYGLKISYRGPFSRAMRDDEVVAIERVMSAAAAVLKMGATGVMDDFNPAQALREMAERLGTPAKMWYSQKQSDQNRAQRQKMEQAAQVAQISKTAAEADRAQAGAQATAAEGAA